MKIMFQMNLYLSVCLFQDSSQLISIINNFLNANYSFNVFFGYLGLAGETKEK